MLTENSTFEKHYRIGDLARTWGLGRETVRKLVKDDPGVIKIRMGRKKVPYGLQCSGIRRAADSHAVARPRLGTPAKHRNQLRLLLVSNASLKIFVSYAGRSVCLSMTGWLPTP